MLIRSLSIRHFRNIQELDWTPGPGLNLVWGRNGEGKTNLLEAVHYALTGRSFRTRRDEECLPWASGNDAADPTRAEVTLVRERGDRILRLMMGRNWKRAFADGQWLTRLADLLAEAAVVTFTPEEAGLFKGPPSARRVFLDRVLCQISRPYLETLQRYNQALRQLNALLKGLRGQASADAGRETARAYYPVIAQSGAMMMISRARRLGEACAPMNERHAELGGRGELALRYDPDLRRLDVDPADPATDAASLAELYQQRLEDVFEDARRLGACPLGVHRDDFSVQLDGQDLRRFGSQGQHRLAALTLKLESARWIEMMAGEAPILLLDDFGSELDPARREAVLRKLRGSMQVIITATDPADLGAAGLFDAWCRIEGGRLIGPAGASGPG